MNSDEPAVVVKDLYKSFKLPHEQHSGVKQLLVNFAKRKKGYEIQHVLDNISFEIKKGEFFGVVGKNGSGKSTLLKLLAGIYAPDKGLVKVNGTLTPFIELGVGFNPELTGRENVFMNGALLGFSRKEMLDIYDDIVKFAELEKFMDQKLKNYSSGMQVRLAFSIAIRAKSDVLLIDEVLAVGDAAFQAKCFDYFQQLKQSDTTVIFISHDRTSLERFCERGILIDKGKIIDHGPIKKVLGSYSQVVLNEMDDSRKDQDVAAEKKIPTIAKIEKVHVMNSEQKVQKKFKFKDEVFIKFTVRFLKDVKSPILGATIWQKNVNRAVFACNTLIDDVATPTYSAGDEADFIVRLPDNINDGEYVVEPAIANNSATVFYDQVPNATNFIIVGGSNPHSLLSSDYKIQIDSRSKSKK